MRNSSSTYTISTFSSSSLFFFIFSNEMKENKEKEENTIEKMGKSQSKPLPPKVGQGWDPRTQCVQPQPFPVQTSDAAFPPLHCMPLSAVIRDDQSHRQHSDQSHRLHPHGCSERKHNPLQVFDRFVHESHTLRWCFISSVLTPNHQTSASVTAKPKGTHIISLACLAKLRT